MGRRKRTKSRYGWDARLTGVGVASGLGRGAAAGAVVAAGRQVLLVAGAHVLEPHLSHALGQSGQVGDALQVLAVGIRIEQEVGLQDVQLLLGERRPHPFRLAAAAALRIHFCWKKSPSTNEKRGGRRKYGERANT